MFALHNPLNSKNENKQNYEIGGFDLSTIASSRLGRFPTVDLFDRACLHFKALIRYLVLMTQFTSISDSSRRLLIFVNPKSGAGLGARIFKQKVFPTLNQNAIRFELIKTEFPGHAANIVVNAIIERSDCTQILSNLPFAIVPCGSGNGLLSSVFAHQRLPIDNDVFVNTAIEALTSPNAISLPVNLIQIQTPDRTFGSFLSIDIESESLRTICGGNRFFWGAIRRILSLRSYRARLSYLEAPSDLAPDETEPISVYGEKLIEKQPNHVDSTKTSDVWSSHVQTEIPNLDVPVQSKWKTLEDEFISVYAVSTSHISNINIYAPDAQLNEQQMHLTYILKRDIANRTAIAKFLTAFETHQHLELPFCHYVKVRAFRLESLEDARQSPFVVDGELIPFSGSVQKLQAVVSNLCMRVLTE
ncbi:Sphk-1 [Aphelenchoides besseyi]|nr:Sphk-1 [Aphelenchoides besseyi]KAI6194582.1 Sphk-1 [Aphelenchoides besseyi]